MATLLQVSTDIPQDVWEVIKETEEKYRGTRLTIMEKEKVEKEAKITLFDGGCFLSLGPEFDLFVIPERRGKWKIKKTISEYVGGLLKEYGFARVEINRRNTASLRLALWFGFIPVSENGDWSTLEVRKWAV